MSARSLRRRVLCAALAVAARARRRRRPCERRDRPTRTCPVSVQITSVSPSVLRPGEDLHVQALLRNDGDTEIERPQRRAAAQPVPRSRAGRGRGLVVRRHRRA